MFCINASAETNMEDVFKKYSKAEYAVFAGGCFWCIESSFELENGVNEVISGYTGGITENPSYEEVSSGKTGHAEAVIVFYNPEKITYEKLLKIFWRQIDPTDNGGSFVDRGNQYRSGIFFVNEIQRKKAEQSKLNLEKSKIFTKPVVTEITKFKKFFPAEEYHQNYYKKNNSHYKYYRENSGRDQFIGKYKRELFDF